MKIVNNQDSPIILISEFISKLEAESLAFELFESMPETSESTDKGHVVKDPTKDHYFEHTIELLAHIVEQHYGVTYKGTQRPELEWIYQGTELDIRCENSEYVNRKWVRKGLNDFTAVLFLTDQMVAGERPADIELEHIGGYFEFPNHQFKISPKAGTLIIFPSGAHFLNKTTKVQYGNLKQVRFQISSTVPWFYHPEQFPGDYNSWFNE